MSEIDPMEFRPMKIRPMEFSPMEFSPMDFSPMEFRKALGAFMTGVTVIATLDREGRPVGFTANSFTSVSLDPPLVLFCIAKTSASCPVFLESGRFAINILAEDQRQVSSTFAAKAADRFGRLDWRSAATGCPVLSGSAAWFDCVLHDRLDAGDHLVLVGRVVDFGQGAVSPLGYCRGGYVTSILEHEAIEAGARTTRVGVILESRGRVLLLEDPGMRTGTGRRRLPESDRLGGPEEAGSLRALLAGLGVEAEIGFVFAVFEPEDPAPSDGVSIYYRGEITGAPPEGLTDRLFPFGEIPWPTLPSDDMRTMLRRYVDESLEGRYGVYVGDRAGGTVRHLDRGS